MSRSLLVLLLGVCQCFAEPVSFEKQVKPILAERCAACHQGSSAAGRFSVTNVAQLLDGGMSGAAVKPGKPADSLLLQVVSGTKPRMPKFGDPLTAAQIALLRTWVEEGAKNDGSAGGDEAWWSLRPLERTSPPEIKDSWIRTPVDRFILATLRAKKLKPSPEADRRTLIRRLYFDLHGLPPSFEEIEVFVRDESAGSYERLVDKLLASPRYGERWARHWLDIVHYGDTHGYDKDKPRPNAWPYRDYVIDALNSDKPYATFVREQIAGDVLFPDDPEALVATGFLAAGPWDFVGHQELREGTVEKNNTRLLDRDDMVATTMSTFVSMTAHCARCHNHKFDPIPQEDYYNLQAVFAGVDRADRPWDPDPVLHLKRQALLVQKKDIQKRLQVYLDKVEFATSPEVVKLDDSIQDAKLLMVHMGSPKTPAEAGEKARFQARVKTDSERRKLLVDALVGAETYKTIESIRGEMAAVDAQMDQLPKPRLVYSGANYFERAGNFRPSLDPRPVFVLQRGSVQAPGKPAVPGALRCVPGLDSQFRLPYANAEGSRRAALANWIANDQNVLTWRSIVNRIWHYHFGNGIVDSPSDFGRMGSKPTHPELLEYLALWFRDDAQGSLKKLHKAIVMSAVYRQSSQNRPEAAAIDADNRLLWRMNRTRLDAEEVRDTTLAVAGKLDLTMGGPGVRMFFFKDDHSPVYDYTRFDADSPGAYRRSIYRFIVRSVPDPLMERLDCPDPSVLTPKRSTTLTAIQALAMLNNPFITHMSEHFAELLRGLSSDGAQQVNEAVRLALGRSATPEELKLYADYASRYGLPASCRLLFNTNEFLFLD